jgi:hypothetical protein
MALAAKDQMTFPRVKAYAEGSGERVKEEIPMIPLANNVQNVWDGSGCLKKRSGHQCLGLLFVVALLCLNPALSAQQLVTSYPLPVPKFVVLGWLYAPMGALPTGR